MTLLPFGETFTSLDGGTFSAVKHERFPGLPMGTTLIRQNTLPDQDGIRFDMAPDSAVKVSLPSQDVETETRVKLNRQYENQCRNVESCSNVAEALEKLLTLLGLDHERLEQHPLRIGYEDQNFEKMMTKTEGRLKV